MNIHEYQAKELLKRHGVAVLDGYVAWTADEAAAGAAKLPGPVYVVKSQIHAGGRGAGRFADDPNGKGGVRLAHSVDEVKAAADAMIGHVLVTKQTGPAGRPVHRVYVEAGCDIARELYFSMLVDRASGRVTLVASTEGGMEIEEVAAHTPEKIHKVAINPRTGLTDAEADGVARRIGVPDGSVPEARRFMQALYRAFVDCDASLAEINPLILTADGRVLALDAKLNFDDNALFRHPEIVAMRDLDEEDPAEIEASKFDLSYISLGGNIGCLVNGAGLAMATMDVIKLFGAEPANFLDVGGGATTQKVTEAFKLMLKNPAVKGILVNIFGGIMRCDTIAEGVIAAAREVNLSVPLVVRMKGTNEDLGRKLLAESGLAVISADNMADAARQIVAAVAGK